MTRTGIVVAQLGGPRDLAEVEPFIRSIIADPYLVPLPGGAIARSALSTLVSRLRAPRVRRRYEAIGSASPIVALTQQQADAMAAELEERGHDVVVAVAHRHGFPDTAAAVDRIVDAAVERVVMLPLFPQYSGTTTGSSEAELRRVLADRAPGLDLRVVRSWCEHPGYLDFQAGIVDEMVATIPTDELGTALVVFCAHSLPQRIIDSGDPYVEEVEAMVTGLTKRLERNIDYVVAYQSQAGPVPWKGPDVRDVVEQAARDGRTWLGVVPVSFVADNLETLHELDIDLRNHAEGVGIRQFHRSSCMNATEPVGAMLADIVEAQL